MPQAWQSFQHLTISGLHDRLQAHSPLRLQPNSSGGFNRVEAVSPPTGHDGFNTPLPDHAALRQ